MERGACSAQLARLRLRVSASRGHFHTFSRFLIAHFPEHMATFQGVLGIPFKRGTQKLPVD
jgi:hypothetical protein